MKLIKFTKSVKFMYPPLKSEITFPVNSVAGIENDYADKLVAKGVATFIVAYEQNS